MTSVSAADIILTPNQPVGRRQPQRVSNPGPTHQESRALPTELPLPHVSEGLRRTLARKNSECAQARHVCIALMKAFQIKYIIYIYIYKFFFLIRKSTQGRENHRQAKQTKNKKDRKCVSLAHQDKKKSPCPCTSGYTKSPTPCKN